jgi:hypothetical protein
MKKLSFTIAQKIASDKNPNTVMICCSILKEAFIMEGATSKQANAMAVDAIKIILKTMITIGQTIKK